MVSITHCLKKYKPIYLITIVLSMYLCINFVIGADIQSQFIQARYADSVMLVDARYKIALNPTLEEALNNGVSLPFICEMEITRPRWYALYRDLFSSKLQQTYRLSFHGLTRQYRLSQGSYFRNFNSLPEALAALGIFHNWQALDSYISETNYKDFTAKIRMRLDISQLPKPYQITTLGNNQWSLESEWSTFRLQDEAPGIKP